MPRRRPSRACLAVLRRLVALDAALVWGVWVPGFARRHRTTTRNVQRDLATLRALGMRIVMKRTRGDGLVTFGQDMRQYPRGTLPLFTRNLPTA